MYSWLHRLWSYQVELVQQANGEATKSYERHQNQVSKEMVSQQPLWLRW